jgi:cytochrome c553
MSAMHANVRSLTALQAAVIRADLNAVRDPARRLAAMTLPAGLPETAARHVNALVRAAQEAEAANDATTAAFATAHIMTACGACHRTVGAKPSTASSAMPTIKSGGHMLEHQRAVEQLMQGLVLPSDVEWRAGARALRAAPLHARGLPDDSTLTPQMLRIEEGVHRLAEAGLGAETPERRAAVYGTLLAACADCHRLRPRGLPPGARR